MKKNTKMVSIFSALAILTTVAASFSSASLAYYVEGKKTDQSAYGLGGERKISIFFNANIWKQGKDSSGNIVDASYYLYVWNTSDAAGTRQTLTPSAHVTPTIEGTVMDLYVFEFDATILNSMIFLRWDPTVAPSTDLTYGNGRWNKTIDLSYSTTYNYYCIDAWGPDEFSGGPALATPTHNKINKANDGMLTWGNPA